MKNPKLLLLTLVIFALSCSKDDDAKPNLESASPSIAESTVVVTPPTAMTSSSDPYAQMASAWIQSVNGIGAYTTYFKAPEGAVKGTTKITASNGRSSGTTGEYLVYTWNDTQSGYSVAFQVSDESDHYTWEVFFKASTATEWLKYVHAEEKKDKSSGFMKVYDVWELLGDDPSGILASYTWERTGDIFTFEMNSDLFELHLNLTINTKTKAGSVTYYFGHVKTYEMTWDANGNGTWKSYDEQGNIDEQGSWTA